MDEIIGPEICKRLESSSPVYDVIIITIITIYIMISFTYIYNIKGFWMDFVEIGLITMILMTLIYYMINIPSPYGYASCINDWESVENYCNYHNYTNTKCLTDSNVEIVNQTGMWTEKGTYPEYCSIPMFYMKLVRMIFS